MKQSEKILGTHHSDTLKSKVNYAIILKRLERVEEAEKIELEVIKARE